MTSDRAEAGKLASARGFANESRLLAALMARGYNASRVDLPHSTYDIIVQIGDDIVRIQARTIGDGNSIGFTGGTRGGVDREYKSGVKEYTQSTETSDIVIGVKVTADNGDSSIDYYFVPTLFIEKIDQKSISINKIPHAKNRWDILERCKDTNFVDQEFANVDAKWKSTY